MDGFASTIVPDEDEDPGVKRVPVFEKAKFLKRQDKLNF